MKEVNTHNIPSTAHELNEILTALAPADPSEIDTSSIKYAIYARKSTSGEERQESSIEDQIRDCLERVVTPLNLKVIDSPIEERCSAKEPHIRPKFNQLLEDIRAGRISGIVAWHPDRLSRNMKEAGEIIDLLDKGVLKDLQFATSKFQNNPSGKMLLGISFVLSKQYSEHLSESVRRGNRRKTEEGIFFDEQKHGYYINDGRLYPDPEGYVLIKKAFKMRLEGCAQTEIANWLNNSGYRLRRKNKDPKTYIWDKDAVSKMLKDPVYAGVLKYGKATSVLSDYYDFEPIISVNEFFKINKISNFDSPTIKSAIMANKRETTKARLLRQLVYCGYCTKPFSSGLTTKKLKTGTVSYYFYRCETNGCDFKNKSVRAKYILEYAIDFLDTHLFTTPSNYELYLKEAKQLYKYRDDELIAKIKSLNRSKSMKETQYETAKSFLLEHPKYKEHYNLGYMKSDISKITTALDKAEKDKKSLSNSLITYKEYLELFKSISVIIRETHDIEVMDQILRKFFSNFTVKQYGIGKQQRRQIVSNLNEPFAGFIKTKNFESGRG